MLVQIPKPDDHVSSWFSCKMVEWLEGLGVVLVKDLSPLLNSPMLLGKGMYCLHVIEIVSAMVEQRPIASKAEDEYALGHRPPAVAVDFPAGSPEKVEQLRLRAEKGEELFHEDDSPYVYVRELVRTKPQRRSKR